MKHSNPSRLLSLLLVLAMVLSMLPMTVFAAGETAVLVTDVADLAAGDKVVIVASNYDYALSTNQKTNNRGTAAITKDGSTVTLTDEVQVLTLEAGTVDGTWAFKTDAGYLYAAGQSKAQGASSNQNYLRTSGTLDANGSWAIEIADGVASIVAQGDNGCNTMQYNANSTLFSAYSSASQGAISIYKLTSGGSSENPDPSEGSESTTPSEPSATYALTDTLTDGDVVIIYNAGNSAALTSTASGYKLAALTLTPEGDVITTDDETAVWTVGVSEDGTYTFTQGDMVLGMVQSGSYVNLSTNASDGYTAWTLSAGSGDKVFYMKNTNMPEGSYGPYYLEYFSGFTAYSSTSPSDAAYGMSFYKLAEETTDPTDPTESEPTDPTEPEETTPTEEPEGTKATLVTDLAELSLGDEIILVAPGYSIAMGVSNGNYFNPADVTMSDNLVYFGDNVQTLILESGLTEGTYAFNASGYYPCAVSGSSNYLKQEVSVTAYSSWTIEIADGIATIKSTGDAERNWIRYNNGSPRFSCYKSGQQDIAIYKVERPQYAELTDELADGTEFVIYYPKGGTVISTTASGNKLTGVAATPENDFLLVEEGMAVLTASVDENGYYTLTNAEGQYLTCGSTGNSLTFEDASSDYSLWLPEQTNDGWLIKSVNAVYSDYAQYIEVYNGLFTTFSLKDTSDTSYYTMQFYALTDKQPTVTGKPSGGDQVVLYNLSAKGVLAAENDTQSIENALAEVVDGVAYPANGGVIFTVEQNGNYYRFYNETYGYLCSNGTGNNAFYSLEASEDADWTLTAGKSGGWNLESRTAKYNGTYSQYLEYYADSYKTYSMYNVTDYDIYEFMFYPVAEGVNVTEGIVNVPTVVFGDLPDVYVGVPYELSFTVDAPFGVESLTCFYQDQTHTGYADGSYRYQILVEEYTGEDITVVVEGVDTKGVEFYGSVSIKVVDEPSITDVTPAANTQTGEDKHPVISAVIVNEGENPTVTMTVGGETVDAVYTPAHTEIDGLTAVYYPSTITYNPAEDMADGRTTVTVTVTRADGKTASKTWSFTVGEAQYQLYFGQLHSHTTYSDGSGSLETALEYIANLPESANVDFVAFTDHSNYFDTTSSANPEQALYDMSLASESSQNLWSAYKNAVAAFNASHSDLIAIAGFEMTWSGGPGHINTFNTPGIVSRNNTTLNNKTSDAGMKAYYSLLSQNEGIDSISQFNHPGSTFGTFSDFAYWDAVIDSRIYLVEVGNGEGAIGAGGYYPSYEYYTMALDKGWHVAPTNNQDNHKGKWGNANDARDVILTDNFTEEGIYEAIQALRMYATEDKNLEVTYTVNDQMLGSIIEEVPESLNIAVTVYDPDTSDSISKVEVIVNSGKVAYTWDDPADLADGALECTLSPDYSYYYIRVTEGDGDLAVTAPVWVGESLKLGISSVVSGTSTPVTGEELTITTTLFNSESSPATIKSLTYTVGSQVLGVDTTGYTIPASGNTVVTFAYTPDIAKVMSITVTAVVDLDGVEYTFSMDVELDVQDASKLIYIGIDASHYNEYVNGNYKDSMGNFSELAAEYNVRTVTLFTSEELIAACSNDKYVALILTAPSRRLADAQSDPKVYTEDELAAIAAFNANGGTVILAGWSDNYENYDVIQNNPEIKHMAETQNEILEALGSSLRISDDATYDDVRSAADGVDKWRLYFSTYGDSFLTEGVEVDPEHPYDRMYTEVFSHYGGASVYTVDGTLSDTVTPIVYGHSSTYSVDVDGDGLGGESIPKYEYADGDSRLLAMASEQLDGKGLIIVSGAAFMSNFEVQATIEDSGSEKNYSNYKICENLLAYLNPVEVTTIAEVHAQTDTGVKYTIEGVVTSNASGYDKNTAFFDCVYVQDSTGGICCFPVAGNYKIGDVVRVTGTTDFYQGEPELQVTSIEVIGEAEVTSTAVTAAQVNDRSVEGQLVTVTGTVERFEYANELVQTIMVKDKNGDVVRVFIDGYITTSEDVKDLAVGCSITVTGLASYDDTFNAPEGPFPRIRIRDRADVVCTAAEHVHSYEDGECTVCGEKDPDYTEPSTPSEPEHKHCYGEWITVKDPTSKETGLQERYCECGAKEQKVIDKLTNPFADVKEDAYYYEPVLWAVYKGVTAGIREDAFGPNNLCTRAQVVTFLWRAYGSPEPESTENPFTDVTANSYYYKAVLWAVENGITAGVSSDKFGPSMVCTRAQVVTFLWRAAGSPESKTTKNPFADVTEKNYYYEPVLWAVENGITAGVDATHFGSGSNCTRAQIVTFLYKAVN